MRAVEATAASSLWDLALAAVNPATAGSQGRLTLELFGRSFDTNRDVRVQRENGPQSEEEDDGRAFPPTVWQGPLAMWIEAVRVAASRTASIHMADWQPGPYEADAYGARS